MMVLRWMQGCVWRFLNAKILVVIWLEDSLIKIGGIKGIFYLKCLLIALQGKFRNGIPYCLIPIPFLNNSLIIHRFTSSLYLYALQYITD